MIHHYNIYWSEMIAPPKHINFDIQNSCTNIVLFSRWYPVFQRIVAPKNNSLTLKLMLIVNLDNINEWYLRHGMSPTTISMDYNIPSNLMVTCSLIIESCKPSPQNMVLLQAWVNEAKLDLDPLQFTFPYLGTKAHGMCIQNRTAW